MNIFLQPDSDERITQDNNNVADNKQIRYIALIFLPLICLTMFAVIIILMCGKNDDFDNEKNDNDIPILDCRQQEYEMIGDNIFIASKEINTNEREKELKELQEYSDMLKSLYPSYSFIYNRYNATKFAGGYFYQFSNNIIDKTLTYELGELQIGDGDKQMQLIPREIQFHTDDPSLRQHSSYILFGDTLFSDNEELGASFDSINVPDDEIVSIVSDLNKKHEKDIYLGNNEYVCMYEKTSKNDLLLFEFTLGNESKIKINANTKEVIEEYYFNGLMVD